MPHKNGEEEAENEDAPAKDSEELAIDAEEEEAKEQDDSPAAATNPAKKEDSPPPAPPVGKPEEAAAAAGRWPSRYPPAGGRHPMAPPMPPPHPGYYGYDYAAWGQYPPPHGPPRGADPYARAQQQYPAGHSPPNRRASGEGAEQDPSKKGSPGTAEERAAYEEQHGYPPHMHHMRPPPYGAYGMPPPYGYPPHYYEEHHRAMMEHESRKRQAEKEAGGAPEEAKRTKTEEKPDDDKSSDEEKEREEQPTEDDAAADKEEERPGQDEEKPTEEEDAEPEGEAKPEKAVTLDKDGKRVISPTSSLDGTQKGDDSTSQSIQYKLSQSSSGSFPPGEPRPPSATYDPYYHARPEGYPYGGASRGPYPPYGYHPMYAGYPPPPHYHRGGEHPPPPGWAGYYDAPPSPRSAAAHYRGRESYPPSSSREYSGPHPVRGSFESAGSAKSAGETPSPKEQGGGSPAGSMGDLSPQDEKEQESSELPKKIKSVSDWRAAAMATGMAPSANRCIPLQEPIPSKCWGTPEHAETIVIPDFHRLVNYPDYLIKNYPDYLRKTRTKSGKGTQAEPIDKDGKRHCVMCGQSRLCSAASGKAAPSTRVRTPKFATAVDEEGDEDASQGGTTHIIPRQNKGLCTACDITVWVIADSHVEIKWCKGCKNFRPWAAFGDKGMATKCVRCRDRQREKYASQKDRLRANRQKKMSSEKDDHHEMAAARGLRDLMSASMTTAV